MAEVGDFQTFVDLLVKMTRMVESVHRRVGEMAADFDLTEAQYNCLRTLRGAANRNEELSQADLSRRMVVSRANMSLMLDKLESRALISRRTPTDKRIKRIRVTELGRELLAKIDEPFERLLFSMVGDMSPDQARQIMRQFDQTTLP